MILDNDHVSLTSAVNAILVNNPECNNKTYVLPLLIVNFGSSRDPPLLTNSNFIHSKIITMNNEEEKENKQKLN